MRNSACLTGIVVSLIFTVSALATPAHSRAPSSDTSVFSMMNVVGPYLRLNEVKTTAARHFLKRYPSVNNEKWLKLSDGFVAEFTDHTIRHQAFYDLQGRFLYTLEYYEEKDLAAAIKTIVRKNYPDYSIRLITELTTDDGTFYVIDIYNKARVKTIEVNNNDITLLKDMINGETCVASSKN